MAAYSYPLSLPDTEDLAFMRQELRPAGLVAVMRDHFTQAAQVQELAGDRWLCGVTLLPLTGADARTWRSFFTELRDGWGTFLMGDATRLSPEGTPTGAPVVDGAGQTGFTLATRGWTIGSTENLVAGDLISIGTGEQTRLYEVQEQVDADGTGRVSFGIWPRLRESPGDGASITTTNPRGTFRLVPGQSPASQITVGELVGLSFRAEEAL